ncbi:MAG: hypothetical protein V4619_09520 [Bacteroidota bacterium]
MKVLATILLGTVLLTACGRESSPDGRSQIRDEKIQQQIDSLKSVTKALADSISIINNKLVAK